MIITKSHNSYCSAGVMKLCLLNLLILIDCFLCNSYSCVLFDSLSHVINSKFQKSELGKFIPNFPLKHVITSTNKSPCYAAQDFFKVRYHTKI